LHAIDRERRPGFYQPVARVREVLRDAAMAAANDRD
jgi:hypothetical protein